MPKRIASKTHVWVHAVVVRGNARDVAAVTRRGYCYADPDDRLEVLDTYCSQCRRSYADVGTEIACPAANDNTDLIGGPIGTRKKRDHSKHDCDALDCNPDIPALQRAVGYEPPRRATS